MLVGSISPAPGIFHHEAFLMQRLIKLEGCLNFRDLGGYPTRDGRTVRWRQLFRSDALHELTPGDVALLRDDLGIRDVVDLRSTAELQSDGQGLLGTEAIRFHHLPLFESEATIHAARVKARSLAEQYLLLVEFAKDQIARVIAALASATGPAVYHCAAGKDRTGVISAVLLGLLGVTDDIIVVDYVATRQNLDAIIDRLMASKGYRTTLSMLPPETLHAEPETMIDLLERIRAQYGSVREYALYAGVAEHSIESLEGRLLTRESV